MASEQSASISPQMQALAEAMAIFGRAVQSSIERMVETANYFGLLVKRTHHRGRDGRWQQHMKLRMMAEGYRLTRQGWQKGGTK